MNYNILLLILLVLSCNNENRRPPSPQQPNVLLILVDDMGYNGISCFGDKPWQTPNIDRIAQKGMKFTQAYAAPVCSPTRAALLTGKAPARVGITNWIPGWAEKTANPKLLEKPFRQHLPLEEYTIAEALKNNGYETALVGKWHLSDRPNLYPDKQGFDYHYMLSNSNLGTWFVNKEGGQVVGFGRQESPNSQFLTDHLVDKSVDWLKFTEKAPWFLMFSTHVVHKPIAAQKEVLRKYLDQGLPQEGPDAADYAAMHEHMDRAVGRLLKAVDEVGKAENTIVIFLSDNGGRIPQTSNAPLRGGKGELLEGGIRVPLIIRWPGKVEAGSVSESLAIAHDLYPTILELTGSDLLPNQHLDGLSLAPILRKKATIQDRTLFWHYPHYTSKSYGKPSSAIRKGKWKLIDVFEFNGPELYDLEVDVGETNNLASEYPKMVEEMMRLLDQWRQTVGAKMPIPNPDYDPAKPSGWPEELAR